LIVCIQQLAPMVAKTSTRLLPPGWPIQREEHACAARTWHFSSFLLLVAFNAIIFPGASFVLSQKTGTSPAPRGAVATIRHKGSQSTQLLPAANHIVSNSQRQFASMPWCQLGCCAALLLVARCTTKRGCKTQHAASCKLLVTGSLQKETQQDSAGGQFVSPPTFTRNVILPAVAPPRFTSVASSTHAQVMWSSTSSQQHVAVPSMLTQCLRTRRGRENSSRKAGARGGHARTRAERTARRVVGQRLLHAREQPVAIQLSYDASRVRTKLQLALLAPEHLHSERPREAKTPAASHTLSDQSVVLMPAYTKSIGVSFPDY